jgi:hypothetical protein
MDMHQEVRHHERKLFFAREERAMRKLFRSLPAEQQALLTEAEPEDHTCKFCEDNKKKETN